MKVAYVAMTFPARPETFACTDVRVLRDAGVGVAVYSMRSPKDDPATLLEERGLSGLVVKQGTLAADLKGLASCLRRPALVARLVTWLIRSVWKQPIQLAASLVLVPRSVGILAGLQRDRPDIVHLFWGHYPCIVGYLVLKALPDAALSMFLGAYDLTRAYGGTGWVARRANLVWTHAACNLPALAALGVPPDRIHLAYRGMDLRIFKAQGRTKTVRRIVSVGRLIAPKAMDDVLQVFCDVHARWPDATLAIVGDGPERARLERLSRGLGIEHAVTFMGHLPQRDVAREMSASEVFLLMSRKDSERLPNVVKEAMGTRCVCVVAHTQGMDELLDDGRHGFLVPQGDVKAAAARIDDIFSGRVGVKALLDAASDHVARVFDASASMDLYRRHWEAVTAGRTRLESISLESSART